MGTVLEARQQRGLELAATVKIVRKRNEWIVPSQFGKGRYKVRAISKRKFKCNCPDHETNGGKCKHIFAVQYIQQLDLFDHPIDQNPWAHWRSPMDMMRQGWSTSLFHAAQQWSTRSS